MGPAAFSTRCAEPSNLLQKQTRKRQLKDSCDTIRTSFPVQELLRRFPMFEIRRRMCFSKFGTLLLPVAFAGTVLLAGPQNKAQVSGPQLVSVEKLPAPGAMCELVSASATTTAAAFFQERSASGSSSQIAGGRAEIAKRPPQRVIRDTYSAYSAVAVDP